MSEHVIRLGTSTPRDSERMVREALDRCRTALARRDVAAVVYELRALPPGERDRLEELLTADPEPGEPWGYVPQSERGQALVEFALVAPLLLLLIVGGMMLGLAMLDRQSRTWEAQEAAHAAATAGAEDSACLAAIAAAEAVSGRSYAACDGSDGLAMQYEPAASPGTVTITIDGGSYVVPFGDPVTVAGRAAAVLRSAEPSPSTAP